MTTWCVAIAWAISSRLPETGKDSGYVIGGSGVARRAASSALKRGADRTRFGRGASALGDACAEAGGEGEVGKGAVNGKAKARSSR